jgi:hypothetical protein
MSPTRGHAGPPDPFSTLVRAGADPDELHRLCAYVSWGASRKQLAVKIGKRVVQLRRAEELRARRFPERLRKMAREVGEYISNPAFDPRRLLPKPAAKLTLRERMEPQHGDVRTLVCGMLNLPKALSEFAYHLDLCLRLGTAKLSVGIKTGDTLSRALILLLDYVEKTTHSPRYQTLADLVNEILQLPDDERVGPDELGKLRTRNPRLRKSPKFFQV